MSQHEVVSGHFVVLTPVLRLACAQHRLGSHHKRPSSLTCTSSAIPRLCGLLWRQRQRTHQYRANCGQMDSSNAGRSRMGARICDHSASGPAGRSLTCYRRVMVPFLESFICSTTGRRCRSIPNVLLLGEDEHPAVSVRPLLYNNVASL